MVEQQIQTTTSALPQHEAATALPHHPIRLLRKGEVLTRTGLKNSTMYAYIQQSRFQRPVKPGGTGTRNSYWLESEVEQWIANGVAMRDSAITTY